MGISLQQLLIVLVIVALVFGTKRLRNIGSDLGKSVRDFKDAMHSDDEPDDAPKTPLTAERGSTVEGEVESRQESGHKD